MSTFYGNNDESTLIAVAESFESEAARTELQARVVTSKAYRVRLEMHARWLRSEAAWLRTCAQNGPPPDLSKLTITIPPESLKRLTEDAGA